jgi:formate-dependent nitrite reductase cytochrome c552 subunit
MTAQPKPFVVARNKHVATKQRRIERLPSGYAVREFYNNPKGHYWYVITSLEVVRATKRQPGRRRSGGD